VLRRWRSKAPHGERLPVGSLLKVSPLTRRSSFPVMESAEERIGIFVTQEVSSLVQIQRSLQKVVASELPPCFLQNLLKRYTGFGETTLQGSGA